MKLLSAQPTLAERVHRAILTEIAEGRLASGERIVQERLAAELGVSRQPVQQALALLKNQRILLEAPGRGLLVAPIDLDHVRQMSDLRAVIEGLAARRSAEHASDAALRQGPALIRAGRQAAGRGLIGAMIAADVAVHNAIYQWSGNDLIAPTLETHWTMMQRVMGEVLARDETPHDIWDQHEALLDAIAAGDADRADALAREHILQAAQFMLTRLAGASDPSGR
ncbi:MAG: GntR family transcriptional regulator [Burkholderiaceae bacterium]